MKLGIFAKTFSGDSPAAILAAVRDAGFETAHYNMACSGLPAMPESISGSVTDAIAAAAAETGVSIPSVSATYNMIHPDPSVRAEGRRRLGVIAAACPRIGARLISLCTGTRDPHDQWKHHPDNRSPDAWRDLLESMRHVLEIAGEFDLELGIEPELANVVNSAEAAHRLIRELGSSRVRVILDPANLFDVAPADRRREIVSTAVDLLGEHIAMGHAKDRLPDGSFTAAGRGVLDYRHYIGALAAAGFSGPVIAHGLTAAEAPSVSRFLRTTMEETL